jgi:hypothetical protein
MNERYKIDNFHICKGCYEKFKCSNYCCDAIHYCLCPSCFFKTLNTKQGVDNFIKCYGEQLFIDLIALDDL